MTLKKLENRTPFSKFKAESQTEYTCRSEHFTIRVEVTRTKSEDEATLDGTVTIVSANGNKVFLGSVAEFNELTDICNWTMSHARISPPVKR
jgi:membrane-bound inhibitor of C-type lysozyme